MHGPQAATVAWSLKYDIIFIGFAESRICTQLYSLLVLHIVRIRVSALSDGVKLPCRCATGSVRCQHIWKKVPKGSTVRFERLIQDSLSLSLKTQRIYSDESHGKLNHSQLCRPEELPSAPASPATLLSPRALPAGRRKGKSRTCLMCKDTNAISKQKAASVKCFFSIVTPFSSIVIVARLNV